ncbi:MAG: DNA/RNA non-specific endonuclease [Myxococcales bacterium]
MQQRMRAVVMMASVVFSSSCADATPSQEPDRVEQGQKADASEDHYEQLVADFGGRDGLADFMRDSSEDEIREMLALYGMTYEVHAANLANPKYIGDCPQYFPASDRNAWHDFDGEKYYIDGSGRPKNASKDLPPVAAAARSDSCQTSIGQWGDAENPSNDYDGGHLIGSQLGGWGKRANIAPQDANFNRGNYAQIENKMATCAGLPNGRIRYDITLAYPNSSALIPNTWSVSITNTSSGAAISKQFTNVDAGGSSGTTSRTAIVNFLSSQGCN